MRNKEDLREHLNKVYVSQDIFDKLKEESISEDTDTSLTLLQIMVKGHDVVLRADYPPNTIKMLKPEIVDSLRSQEVKKLETKMNEISKMLKKI